MTSRRSLLWLALAMTALLAGCGDGPSVADNQVVTTGPEPGAEVSTSPIATVAAASPAATPNDNEARSDDRRKEANTSKPKATPSPAATPTMLPRTTLKPKAQTDEVELAFCRQAIHHALANLVIAHTGWERSERKAVQDLGDLIEKRRNNDLNFLMTKCDVIGYEPGPTTAKGDAADLRRLDVPGLVMEPTKRQLRSTKEPFEDVSDEAFDAAFLDAMVRYQEDGILLATSAVATEGSRPFRRFAAALERTRRAELEQLRALRK